MVQDWSDTGSVVAADVDLSVRCEPNPADSDLSVWCEPNPAGVDLLCNVSLIQSQFQSSLRVCSFPISCWEMWDFPQVPMRPALTYIF